MQPLQSEEPGFHKFGSIPNQLSFLTIQLAYISEVNVQPSKVLAGNEPREIFKSGVDVANDDEG